MTSASLFFKLQKEDLKRRIWVAALLFLGFFFAYPVNLALTMENAANSQFAMYNGYTPLVNTGTPEYLAKVLEYKTKAVVDLVSYGNVMPLFLMVTAAVVIGAAGFAYLHNQKKVDFYHSIPVRREMLYPDTDSHLFYPSFSAYGGSSCIWCKPGKVCRSYALWLFYEPAVLHSDL